MWARGRRLPNENGLRSALVEKMRAIKAPVVRWPGGCFADSYDWRDGIGPKEKRPRRTNFWTDTFTESQRKLNVAQVYEPNQFGTADFVRFAQLCGAEPYIAGNVRSLTPLDFDHWVEYCNSPKGDDDAGGDAGRRRVCGAVQRALLGRGERELGLRRELRSGGLCDGVQAVYDVGSGLWGGAEVCGFRAEQRRAGVDAGIL